MMTLLQFWSAHGRELLALFEQHLLLVALSTVIAVLILVQLYLNFKPQTVNAFDQLKVLTVQQYNDLGGAHPVLGFSCAAGGGGGGWTCPYF